MDWLGIEIPDDPVERIRAVRLLLEVYRRMTNPVPEETYRCVAGKRYGPYLVAYVPGSRIHPEPRFLYLGKGRGCEELLNALWRADPDELRYLATKAVRQLKAVLAGCHGLYVWEVAWRLAGTFEHPEADEEGDPLEDAPPPALEILGPWEAWYSEELASYFEA
ncbi:MAG: DUF1678 domain-containing protein [Methanopyri archaeon]|nr:DUF1678 domain-containing protein [Methanopyri archaeon]